MKQRGVSLQHAVKLLEADLALAASPPADPTVPVKSTTVRGLPAPTTAMSQVAVRDANGHVNANGFNHPRLLEPHGAHTAPKG